MTTATHSDQWVCPRCSAPIAPGELVCARCGGLIYRQHLEQLSAEAQRMEPINAGAAAALWQQALQLLPPDSQQFHAISQRLATLSSGMRPAPPRKAPPAPRRETAGTVLMKTIGSMALSVMVYWLFLGWAFALGLVLLIFIHEMGHVLALRYYRLNASPPIFIPFLGALINLRQPPPDAKVEAVVGIGGPIAGTVGALACFAWYLATKNQLALELSYFGFFLNLFNMIPMPPLDGGRITAAISPWFWILGLLVLGGMVYSDIRQGRDVSILLLVLLISLPRVIATLARPEYRRGAYYAITRRASWSIGVSYIVLLALLGVLMWYTGQIIQPFGGMA